MLLAEKTGNPVILFPLSYHINRGLPEWTDIHRMAGPLEIAQANLLATSGMRLSLICH